MENDDFVNKLGVSSEMFQKKKDKMMVSGDIAQVVWEALSRPARCYQTEIMVMDMFLKDGEVLADQMKGMMAGDKK